MWSAICPSDDLHKPSGIISEFKADISCQTSESLFQVRKKYQKVNQVQESNQILHDFPYEEIKPMKDVSSLAGWTIWWPNKH